MGFGARHALTQGALGQVVLLRHRRGRFAARPREAGRVLDGADVGVDVREDGEAHAPVHIAVASAALEWDAVVVRLRWQCAANISGAVLRNA